MIMCRRAPGRTWVSGRAAARLWKLDGFDDEIVEVVIVANLRRFAPGQIVHNVRTMLRGDVTVLRGLPVTTVHRTLIDVGDTATPDEVELAYECARRRRQTNDERLRRRIGELGTRGRKGSATLDRIISSHEGKASTDSALEVRFIQLNRRFRLPEPQCQHVIRDRDGSIVRVDFFYPGTVVIVEVDGRSVHARKRQMEKDLRRRYRLTAQGFHVLHVTYDRMTTDPEGIAREISLALDQSRA
jgi:very-short-patch-repair endonuclease